MEFSAFSLFCNNATRAICSPLMRNCFIYLSHFSNFLSSQGVTLISGSFTFDPFETAEEIQLSKEKNDSNVWTIDKNDETLTESRNFPSFWPGPHFSYIFKNQIPMLIKGNNIRYAVATYTMAVPCPYLKLN